MIILETTLKRHLFDWEIPREVELVVIIFEGVVVETAVMEIVIIETAVTEGEDELEFVAINK